MLLVLQNEERRNHLAERLLKNNPPVRTMAWLTTFTEITTPLGAIWIQPADYMEIVRDTAWESPPRAHRCISSRPGAGGDGGSGVTEAAVTGGGIIFNPRTGAYRRRKEPGRPIFNEMLSAIERGEAEGIVAWHPDRLARNSVDGGRLIYLLDRRILKDLKFASFAFENTSQGKLMLSVLLGFSKYYVDSLAENVKRGNRAKVERGWRGVARADVSILPNPSSGYG